MNFTKKDNTYIVTRITGSQDNILGIVLSKEKIKIKVIDLEKDKNKKIVTREDEVLSQVSDSLSEFNSTKNSSIKISEIHYLSSESSKREIYKILTKKILERIEKNENFKEIQ